MIVHKIICRKDLLCVDQLKSSRSKSNTAQKRNGAIATATESFQQITQTDLQLPLGSS